jgi:gliding motility-associated-like protein
MKRFLFFVGVITCCLLPGHGALAKTSIVLNGPADASGSNGEYLVSLPATGTTSAPAPTIVISATTGLIVACAGTPSVSPNVQRFTVSGTLLTDDITAIAPAGFEVALSPAGIFGNSVTLTQSGGSVNSAPIYVRSSGAISGNITGNVLLSTPGANGAAPVKGTVNSLPTVNPVADQGPLASGQTTADVNFTGSGNAFTWTNNTPGIGLAATGEGNIPSFTTVNNTGSTLTATVTVTPISASFAYVATQNGVSLFNISTNKIVKTISTGSGSAPYGVVVRPDGKFVYVTNQNLNTVSIISTSTNTITGTVSSVLNPAGIAVSPDGTRLYVANRNLNTITVIDATIPLAVNTINVGLSPDGVAISPDGSMVYATNRSSNTVSVINTSSQQVINIPTGQSPQGVAVTPDGTLFYVTNYNDNNVSVFNTQTNQLVVKIAVRTHPDGISISPDGTVAYVSNSGSNNVSVINMATNTVIATLAVGITPEGISFSPDGSMVYIVNYGSNNMSAIRTTDNFVYPPVVVGTAPISFGNFIAGGSGCSGAPITFKITVLPALSFITATGTLTSLITNYGRPSATTRFDVSGVNIKSGILVTPPTGFEVSTDNITFAKTVTVGSVGNIGPATVYVRLAATTPAGPYSGDITLSSPGASDAKVATANSMVNAIPLTITADNKTKIKGDSNPVLTASYAGFANNEGSAQLTIQPVLATTASISSDIGQYPITVSGAASPNYTIIYVPGILTVGLTGQSLAIPNTFTPNGDGINDTWDIKDMIAYPTGTVDIFDRYGVKVYSSTGYGTAWDGTYKGSKVPIGTYYYIIDLKNNQKAVAGNITVIR